MHDDLELATVPTWESRLSKSTTNLEYLNVFVQGEGIIPFGTKIMFIFCDILYKITDFTEKNWD